MSSKCRPIKTALGLCKPGPTPTDNLLKMGAITKKQHKFLKKAEELGFTIDVERSHEFIPESRKIMPYFKTDVVIRKTLIK